MLLALALVVVAPLVRAVRRGRPPRERAVPRAGLVVDPVCGMAVDPARVHFCSPACARAFREDPERFAAGARR